VECAWGSLLHSSPNQDRDAAPTGRVVDESAGVGEARATGQLSVDFWWGSGSYHAAWS